jgi:hypothetical protein
MRRTIPLLAALLIVLTACQQPDGPAGDDPPRQREAVDPAVLERIEAELEANLTRIEAYADSIEAAMRPVPLLTQPQINAFNRFRNADQLVAARRLGIPQPVTEASMEQHLAAGRLVQLEDNQYYILRPMDYAVPLATPDVAALLDEIGERFQARLAEHGLPPLRMEVTSVLRTAQDQARLRQVNPNAAVGESTHQFGTTIDIAYSSFVAPAEPVVSWSCARRRGWSRTCAAWKRWPPRPARPACRASCRPSWGTSSARCRGRGR